jgi:flagellar motor switch protein FliM
MVRMSAGRRAEQLNTYDFRKTDKFTADQTRFLEKVFVSFRDSVTTHLAPLLQTKFHMDLVSINTRAYHSYLNSLPDPTPLLVFRLEADIQGFLDVDFDLAFALFDRLMGGKGQPPRDEVRPFFTDLEKAVLQRPLTKMLEAYGEAWKEVKQIRAQFVGLEFNPMAVHVAPPSETMVVITFQCEVAAAQGLVNVVLPFRYLRDNIPRASFDEFMLAREAAPKEAQAAAPIFAKNLEGARVPVSVCLGRAELLFQELLSLEVGDVIRLDTEIHEPLRVRVNERTKFLGHPGTNKEGRLACKITQVLQEGDELFDE